jgi:hypothetical protein
MKIKPYILQSSANLPTLALSMDLTQYDEDSGLAVAVAIAEESSEAGMTGLGCSQCNRSKVSALYLL